MECIHECDEAAAEAARRRRGGARLCSRLCWGAAVATSIAQFCDAAPLHSQIHSGEPLEVLPPGTSMQNLGSAAYRISSPSSDHRCESPPLHSHSQR